MDMQTPKTGREPTIGELFKQLADDGRSLVGAEVRIAEAKLVRRAQLAAPPVGMLAVAAALALTALIAVAGAIAALLGPIIGFATASVIVAIIAAIAACVLAVEGRKRLRAAIETPLAEPRHGDGG